MFRAIMILILGTFVAPLFAFEPISLTTAIIISALMSAASTGITAGVSASSASKDRTAKADELAKSYALQNQAMGQEFLQNKREQYLERLQEADAMAELVQVDAENRTGSADLFATQSFRPGA